MKVTKIKKGITVGTQLPFKQYCGNIGRWAEDSLSANGYNVSPMGIDLPDYNIEVKTRNVKSRSYHTVASMTVEEIITNDYQNSRVAERSKSQYRVEYDDDTSIVTDERVWDFTDPLIQSQLEEAYNVCRDKIINGDRSSYIAGNSWGHIEATDSGSSYRYRISHSAMKKMKTIVNTRDTFRRFF